MTVTLRGKEKAVVGGMKAGCWMASQCKWHFILLQLAATVSPVSFCAVDMLLPFRLGGNGPISVWTLEVAELGQDGEVSCQE